MFSERSVVCFGQCCLLQSPPSSVLGPVVTFVATKKNNISVAWCVPWWIDCCFIANLAVGDCHEIMTASAFKGRKLWGCVAWVYEGMSHSAHDTNIFAVL